MENQGPVLLKTDFGPDATLAEIFVVPLWEVELQRPMQLFGKALGLPAGTRATPTADFLIKVCTDYPSHQAWLRAEAGGQYKNLENLLRGRGQRSRSTLTRLEQAMPWAGNLLADVEPSAPDAPLWPAFLQVFQLVEGIPFRLFQALMSHEVACPHCGANVLQDANAWWGSQRLSWGDPEIRLAERLLVVTTTATGLALVADRTRAGTEGFGETLDLATPRRHPIGNWMEQVKKAHGVRTLDALAQRLPIGDGDTVIDQTRLNKWASGMDLMSMAAGRELTAGLPNQSALDRRLIAARMIAFVIDFLRAAAPVERPSRVDVQTLVEARLRQLRSNTLLAASTVHANRDQIQTE